MLFQTPPFFLFFAVFFLFYAATMRRLSLQNFVVMVASYVFYAFWDLRFLSLIIVATAVAFVAGQGASGARIERRQVRDASLLLLVGCTVAFGPGLPGTIGYYLMCLMLIPVLAGLAWAANRLSPEARGRASTIAGVVFNLMLLGFFKYFNFFTDSLVELARVGGAQLSDVTLRIVLPVGISFFTFQKLAYIIDVRRGKGEPETDIIRFGAFVAFFPQLVAGPIERAGHLLRQFAVPRHLSWSNTGTGASLFLWGMFKKVVIADNLATLVAPVFHDPSHATAGQLMVALLAFTFQILCDFSGYSDMARGLARILGLDLMINFNIPYVSRTPSEFWTRWHISLSSWLRDYLYIPLGGNRGGKLLTYRNLFLTMLLGGLWHGASWTFVAWGAFHGGILIVYRLLGIDKFVSNGEQGTAFAAVRDVGLIAVMFVLTVFGWLLFRSPDIATVETFVRGIAGGRGWSDAQWQMLGFYVAPLLLVQAWQLRIGELEFMPRLPKFARLNAGLLMIFALLFLAPSGAADFIYFDF